MDRPAVLEVPQQDDPKARERPERFLQRREIEERLSGVLARAIAGVDHGPVGGARGEPGRPLVRVTNHDRVGVRAEHADRIVEALSLPERSGSGVSDRKTVPSQPVDRGLEGEARPGGRLEERHRDDLFRQRLRDLGSLRVRDHLSGAREESFDLLTG